MLRRKCYVKLFKADICFNNRALFCSVSNDLVNDNVKTESFLPNGEPLKPLQEKEGKDSHVEDEDSCSDWEGDYSRDTGVCLKNYYKNRKCETILNNDVEKETFPRNILKIQDKTQNDNGTNNLRTKQNPNNLFQPYVQIQRKSNSANNSVQFGTSLSKKSSTENPIKFHHTELSCFLCDKQFYSIDNLSEHLMKVHDLHDLKIIVVQSSKESKSMKESFRKVIYAPRKNLKVNIKSDCDNSKSLHRPTEKDEKSKLEERPTEKDEKSKLEEENMDVLCIADDNENIVEETVLMCKKCEKFFYVKDKYSYHIKYTSCNRNWHSRSKKFQCEICGLAFDKPTKLEEHINSHTNARPFKCAECEKQFNSKRARYMHEKQMHQKEHTIHLCYYCGITHVSLPHLLAHEQTHLLPEGAEVPTPFRCQECGKGFISRYKLSRHGKKHRLVKCPECLECFPNRYLQQKHRDEVHNFVRIYKCDVCEKTFKNHGSFTSHKYVHTTVLSFFCKVCDKGFKKKHHLEQHLITHSDYRPIVCSECGETFKRKTHLKQHSAAFHGDCKKG